MKRIKNLLFVAVLVFAVLVGWKAGTSEIANAEFQSDLVDLSSQVGAYSNYAVQRSDDDFRDAVIRDALEHDIQLQPSQVLVQRNGSGMNSKIYLAADYTVPVDVMGYSFTLHFNPTSKKQNLF